MIIYVSGLLLILKIDRKEAINMTKVDIISGFLGAGKTTFIKKLLSDVWAGEKLVLIENEFGEIGIDGGFLKDAGIEITEMNSGCICCTLVGDFSKALVKVLDEYHPDRVIIEPSGVGKLSDVARAIEAVEKDADIEIDGRITVVDGKKAKMYMKNFGEFFKDQVEHASTIVVSRTQMMTDEKVEECVHTLREENAEATIISTPWDELGKEAISHALTKGAEIESLFEDHEDHDHDHDHCDHDHHDHHDHDHDHGHEHEHETDEHIWTSPKNAQLMLSAVYDAICKVDPSGKQTYTKNKDAYAKQLSDLDNAYRSAVDNAKNKTIVLADKFPFRYLAHEYGLEFSAAFAACSDESEPGVSTMIKLTKTIKENNIPAVYYLEFSSTKIADTLCDETGATKLMLHSCHNVSKQDIENNVSYVDLMKQNLENLKLTLNG